MQNKLAEYSIVDFYWYINIRLAVHFIFNQLKQNWKILLKVFNFVSKFLMTHLNILFSKSLLYNSLKFVLV